MKRDREVALLPAGVLAYIGDSVFELLARKTGLEQGQRKLHALHKNTVSLVNASSQAEFLKGIEDILTEEEKDIVRRGKNANTGNIPKNADMIDYRLSTGFEALFGYLHLSKKQDRIDEIWQEILLLLK